jgi:hypothetical protein
MFVILCPYICLLYSLITCFVVLARCLLPHICNVMLLEIYMMCKDWCEKPVNLEHVWTVLLVEAFVEPSRVIIVPVMSFLVFFLGYYCFSMCS